MRRAWIGALWLAALSAQDDAVVELPAACEFGAPFEVVVFAGQPFDRERLSPLVVEEIGRESRGGGERIVYRARCYELDEVTVLGRVLQVRTSLPEPPGPLEWPADGFELDAAPSAVRWWFGLGALLVLLGGVCWYRKRRRGAGAEELPVAARFDAVLHLERLAVPADGVAEPYYRELKAIVRRHCIEHLLLPADTRTSEELVRALPSHRGTLGPCLMACDQVLFGRHRGSTEKHELVRAQAIAFVRGAEERT